MSGSGQNNIVDGKAKYGSLITKFERWHVIKKFSRTFQRSTPWVHRAITTMSHCHSLRIALYRVFVRPALLNPTIPCLLPSSACQPRSNTTLQRPPAEPSKQNSAASNDPPKKRSYKDRLADKEAARSPFATYASPMPSFDCSNHSTENASHKLQR